MEMRKAALQDFLTKKEMGTLKLDRYALSKRNPPCVGCLKVGVMRDYL